MKDVKIIELKCENPHFTHMYNGVKSFEVREKRDRNFRVGGLLHLREYYAEGDSYSGCSILVRVTHILDDPKYVKEGWCIMSVKMIYQ